MLIILSFIMVFLAYIMLPLKDPLKMTVVILIQTLFISLFMMLTSISSWFSLTLMIVFISGMMIVFVYVSSLAANSVLMNFKKSFIYSFTGVIFSLLLMKSLGLWTHLSTQTFYQLELMGNPSAILAKVFNYYNMILVILMFIYLLVILFLVIKNSSTLKAPVKAK